MGGWRVGITSEVGWGRQVRKQKTVEKEDLNKESRGRIGLRWGKGEGMACGVREERHLKRMLELKTRTKD